MGEEKQGRRITKAKGSPAPCREPLFFFGGKKSPLFFIFVFVCVCESILSYPPFKSRPLPPLGLSSHFQFCLHADCSAPEYRGSPSRLCCPSFNLSVMWGGSVCWRERGLWCVITCAFRRAKGKKENQEVRKGR